MAEVQNGEAADNWLAGFSNWDCTERNGIEYEMAPGVDILSTVQEMDTRLGMAHMAAPVASGIAALVRTRFSDKAIYSSRFVMGQVAATGAVKVARPRPTKIRFYHSADALSAITSFPTPDLAFQKYWLFDSSDRAGNDDDGIVDAGETIDLALVIKNHWGKAANVEVTVEAIAEVVIDTDPISWDIQTVNYGAVGSFAEDDNGLVYNSEQLITGVNFPFRFRVAANTPNDHIIPMLVTITASNGLNDSDTTVYSSESRFNLLVQRGRELPRIIDSDAISGAGGAVDTDGVQDGVKHLTILRCGLLITRCWWTQT